MSKLLYIIRGPSGSGKSTIAKYLGGVAFQNWFEYDMYVIKQQGSYNWTPENHREAMKECRKETIEAFERGEPSIIISNTTLKRGYLDEFLTLAENYDYNYVIIRSGSHRDWIFNPSLLVQRNLHGFDEDKITQMVLAYELCESEMEWKDRSIFKASNNV